MANRFWNPSADANWADANVWATTFNGNPTGVATPTSADDCFFTATNSHKCTIGATANCNNLYFDNADNGGNGDYVGTLAGSSFLNVYGNLVMSSGMSVSFSGYLYFKATSGSYNIDTKGISLACVVFVIGVTTQNATYTLQSNLVLTNSQSAITLSSGSFITNGKTLTIPALTCNNAYTKSLNISNSNIEINQVGFMINTLDIDATTTFTSTNSTIKFTDTTNGNIAFAGGGKTYNNIYFSRGASTGSITITGSNTFNDFKDDGTAAHTILFTNGTTQTITTMEVSGTAGNLHTLSNSSGTTVANLTTASAQISNDYLNIAYLNVTPTNVWYAGANSNNTGGADTNWIFTAPPPFTSKNAGIDENGRQTIICAYDGDGQTIIPLQANPINHALEIDDDTTGTDNGNNAGNAMLDQNSRQVWTALSSTGDGTIVEVYANSLNQLLVNSN